MTSYTEDQIVRLYVLAYEEGFNSSSSDDYKTRKQQARNYAAQVCPEGAKAIATYTKDHIPNPTKPWTEQERLGHNIIVELQKKNFHKEYFVPEVVVNENGTEEMKHGSYSALYRSWVEKNDNVPFDDVLSYFLQCSPGAFSGIRNRLKKDGYSFTKEKTGWLITARPVKPEPVAPPPPVVSEAQVEQVVVKALNNQLPTLIENMVKEAMSALKGKS